MQTDASPAVTEVRADDQRAGLVAACEAVGDRWSLPIIASLVEGPLRYTEIQERVPALAPNILSARLRKLEQDGLLVATRYSSRPARFDYRLTADGAALAAPIQLLSAWAAARADPGSGPTHATCGSALEMRWWCPLCGMAAAPGEEEDPILA